jgi:hypothetical protein
MNADRDKLVKEIFADALEKADAAERAAYLAQVCGNDAQLRHQVETLLQAHAKAGGFLAEPPAAPLGKTIVFSTPLTEKPGDRIGRYKFAATNRRRRWRGGLYGRTARADPPPGGVQNHQTGHGHQTGYRPV